MTVSILCTIVSDFFARLFNSFPSANEVLRGQMKGPLIDGENTPFALAYDETIFHRLHQIKPKGIAEAGILFHIDNLLRFKIKLLFRRMESKK